MTLNDVRSAVESAGLAWRGAFHPTSDDMPGGEEVGTLVMLGFIGGAQWAGFAASPEYCDGERNPLDRWSHRVISALACDLGAKAYFPFIGPPFLPFIRWAQKAEPVRASAIGMLIHPEYGLWHAWRGALAFDKRFDLPPTDARACPCNSCSEKPCLSACPANAFAGDDFNVVACGAHIRRPEGADCMGLGCSARRVCPIGAEYRYSSEQAAFHMRSFQGSSPH